MAHEPGQEATVLSGEITVKDICNHYLTYQLQKAEAAEISPRSFEDCRRIVQGFARFVGARAFYVTAQRIHSGGSSFYIQSS